LDYRGFVEGNDIAKGTVDVVVTDGFTGNIVLKSAEGLARYFTNELKATLTSSLLAKLGALIAIGALKGMRRRLDPGRVNGGPLLGLNGIVVKSHGGADANGFASAIKVAVDLARSNYSQEIASNVQRLLANMPAQDTSDDSESGVPA
jgi:glycerol-3-phosphate acyltransferase PlsX